MLFLCYISLKVPFYLCLVDSFNRFFSTFLDRYLCFNTTVHLICNSYVNHHYRNDDSFYRDITIEFSYLIYLCASFVNFLPYIYFNINILLLEDIVFFSLFSNIDTLIFIDLIHLFYLNFEVIFSVLCR